ncbi:unnamed protein product [Thlaspi arvense]|uniref:F-box domain-containing protein n=1 Tax=Thlaspi arvense TaxID=13288 RepID=A0AAU9RF74_THLAR|nr:unnamed protein product [Thlaspi arvense]
MGHAMSFIINKAREKKRKKKTYEALITLLPEDVLMDCVARVPKHEYPNLSLVCKLFRSMVASPDLYARRSSLGCAESCIYVPIHHSNDLSIRWYTLLRSSRSLIPIPSLPPMPYSCVESRYVVVGSRIFVLGGYDQGQVWKERKEGFLCGALLKFMEEARAELQITKLFRRFKNSIRGISTPLVQRGYDKGTNVTTIDCRYDMAQPFGTMPKMAINPAVDVVDGKIYVIGGHYGNNDSSFWSSNRLVVLDTEAQTWLYKETKSGLEAGHNLLTSLAVEDKIYIKGCRKSFAFEAKEGKWKEEAINELLPSDCRGCIIDGLFYSYDTRDHCLRAYDLKQRLSCGVVKGVERIFEESYKGREKKRKEKTSKALIIITPLPDDVLMDCEAREPLSASLPEAVLMDCVAREAQTLLPEDVLMDCVAREALITSLPEDVLMDCVAREALITSLPEDVLMDCVAREALITSLPDDDLMDCVAREALITLLPEDVLMDCVARVPKHEYPNLSLVCKLFRSMVASPDLYARRSLLGCAEYCIYVPIHHRYDLSIRWYTLLQSSRSLVPIPSLPPMPYSSYVESRYVVVGSRIFVLGDKSINVSTIDCRYDMAQPFGTMPKDVINPVVDVVDGKIYVIGGHYDDNNESSFWSSNRMIVLDIEAQTCVYKETKSGLEADHNLLSSVAMGDKIYIKGYTKNFVFEPKEGKWEEETNELLPSNCRGCVIDGILYSYDTRDHCLRAYDLKHRLSCGMVKGVERMFKESYKVYVARSGKKRILLMQNGDAFRRGIWCAEIALMERNQIGEIWGKVEWCQLLFAGGDASFSDCLSVTV